MNASLRFAAAGVVVAGLTACAGTHNLAVADAKPDTRATSTQGEVDYVAVVDQIARRRGVEVHWINPPARRVSMPDRQ